MARFLNCALAALLALGCVATLGCGDPADAGASPDAVTGADTPDSEDPEVVDVADTEGPADAHSEDTATAPPQDTVTAVDTAEDAHDGGATCVVGATRCEGYLLQRCQAPSAGYQDVSVCPLGCVVDGEVAACADACTPGAPVGCVGGSARRCGPDGASSVASACLGGCDAEASHCEPLGASDRELSLADVGGVRVAGVAHADDGRLAIAWQSGTAAAPTPVRLLVTDHDGNALSTAFGLSGSDEQGYAQLQVRSGPDGAFAVLGLSASGGRLWHIAMGPGGAPAPPGGPLAEVLPAGLATMAAYESAVAVFHLAAAGEEGKSDVRRTLYPTAGEAPTTQTVDPAALDRYDVIATRLGADALAFASGPGEVRVTLSSREAAAGPTTGVAAGELLFAGAASRGAEAGVLAYDFDHDPERVVGAVWADGELGPWYDVGIASWAQALPLGDGRLATALQRTSATLELVVAGPEGTSPPTVAWSVPGAAMVDFWLAPGPESETLRLITLAHLDGAAPRALRIRAITP